MYSVVKKKNALLAAEGKQLQYRCVKRQLFPTEEQKSQIDQFLGCMRFIYNDLLDARQNHYEATGHQLSGSEYKKTRLADLKQQKPYLRLVDKFVYDDVIVRQDAAFDRFFKKMGGFPQFKSKKASRQSYTTYLSNNNIRLDGNGVKVPKIGTMPFCGNSSHLESVRNDEGIIKKATILRDGGKYYVSLFIELVVPIVTPLNIADADDSKIIGIDVGIKTQAACNNGNVYNLPKRLKCLDKRMRRYQRSLSRKTKDSANYCKAKNIVNKSYKDISNMRKDYNHKLSKKLVDENQVIFAEDLAVKNMVKNHKLAHAISNCGWSQLFTFIRYKAEAQGKIFHQIHRFYASSQICHCCGCINPAVKDLKVREWDCPECGAHHDRDVNAAINIRKRGLAELTA